MHRASLIVLNFNGREVLGPCLASLSADIHPADEIIVVDNGSSDGSLDLVRSTYPDVRLVPLPENRFIFGLNDGLRAATGEYVAFLNNDMVVAPGFVDALIRRFDSEDIFAVCARILDSVGAEQGSRTAGFWANGSLHYQSLPHSTSTTDCFFAVGGQSLFRRSYLDEIGSIDELLWPMYHEDIELSYRAWKRGWRIRYAPDAVVHHSGSHTSLRVFRPNDLRTFVRQNEFLIVWKNVTDRRLLAQHLVLLPPRALKAVIIGDLPTLRGLGRAIQRLPRVPAARRHARLHFSRTDSEVLDLVSVERVRRDGEADRGGAAAEVRSRHNLADDACPASPPGEGFALEDVACPVCGSPHRSRALTGADALHGAPGTWDVYRCRRCGHAFTSPRPTEESISSFYPEKYEEHLPAAAQPSAFSEANAELLVGLSLAPGRILDVGCAGGAFIASMQRRGWRAWGTGPSTTAAKLAISSTGAAVYSNLFESALDVDGPFDAITLWSVLEHTHEPSETLRRVRALLADDGHLVGVVPNFQSLERRVFGRHWFALELPRHLQHFGPASLVRVLTDSGFAVLEVRSVRGHILSRRPKRRRPGSEPTHNDAPMTANAEVVQRTSVWRYGERLRIRALAPRALTRTAGRTNRGSTLIFVARPSAQRI